MSDDARITHSDTDYSMRLSLANLYSTDAEEHAFIHGVEFGGIYGRMLSGNEAEIEEATHVANREVFARAAAAEGWSIEVTPVDADWDTTRMTKTAPAIENPRGLRVVK